MFRRAGAAITPAICGVLSVTYQYKVSSAVVQIWAAAMQNVGDWLKELGLGQYAQRFADNDIDASILSDLTDQDLEKIGVTLGHRKKLLRAIAGLNGAGFVLEPARRSEAQRRQLTVMFADLAGSTALSARVDPEELRNIMSAYHRRCTEVIAEVGGFVARHLGDGVLAYFGYPQAHEEDAERAVRAGLGLVEAITKLDNGAGTALRVRVGIATGIVVVGDHVGEGAAQEWEVVGETPNLAARLQAFAEPDTVVISSTTRGLIGELFECRALGSVPIKGFSNLVPVWQVTAASAIDSRFDVPRAATTPPVGRDEESELLMRRWQHAKRGEGSVVLISGEPGIGKSRLAQTVLEGLRKERHIRLRCFCSPYHQDSALYPSITQLKGAAGFRDEDSDEQRLDKLEALLAQGSSKLSEAVPVLATLLSIPLGNRYPPVNGPPPKRKEKTLDALLMQVEGLASRQPVLMVFEDVHWSDPTTRELLDRLVDKVRALRVLVITTSRSEFTPAWIDRQHVIVQNLSRLPPYKSAEMIVQVAGGALPKQLASEIIDRANGVPLFIEELTKVVVESGKLAETGGRYALTGAGTPPAIPTTMHASLLARLDRLAADDRALLQAASVIGSRFTPHLLAAVAESTSVEARLSAMERLDLIRLETNSDTYLFKHVLVRDALYAGLLGDLRKALHLRIAGEIERRNEGRLNGVAETLAHHYAQADCRDKAVEYLARVGRKNLGLYSLDEAEHSLRHALAFARAEDGERMDAQVATIMVDLAMVLTLKFKSGEIIALIEPELPRIDGLGDSEQVPILLDFYSVGLFTRCRFREGRLVAEKALAVAERLDDERSKAHARVCVIILSIFADPMPLDEFERFAERAFSEAEPGGDVHVIGRMMMAIAWNYVNRGLALEARQWASRMAKFGRDRHDQRSQGMALWLLGWADIIAGDYASALGHVEQSTQTAIAPLDHLLAQQIMGISRVLLGRVEEGSQMLRQHQQIAMANEWNYSALAVEAPLELSRILRGEIKKGVMGLESIIQALETKYSYQAYADLTRLLLAEFYIELLCGTKKVSLSVFMKNPLFIIKAKRGASRRAETLLRAALRNPQISERGVVRARIYFNLGMIHKAMGRLDLASAHFDEAHKVASAQEAAALIAKIDAAKASREISG
jgi:class 3 adenylate cyclase/tetratricopeptide (TPR) repeat protein